MKNKNSKKAFTLVELSIVLLVMAALVSSVLVGRAIVVRTRIQSIINDIESTKRSFKLFVDTYGGIPGDLSSIQCNEISAFKNLCNSVSSEPATWDAPYKVTDSKSGIKTDNVIQTSIESALASQMMIAANFFKSNPATVPTNNVNFSTAGQIQTYSMEFKPLKGMYMIFGGISGAATSVSGFTNVAGFAGIGLGDTAHWADQNFISIVPPAIGDVNATGPISYDDAKTLKTKLDGSSSSTTSVLSGTVTFSSNAIITASNGTFSPTTTNCIPNMTVNSIFTDTSSSDQKCNIHFLIN